MNTKEEKLAMLRDTLNIFEQEYYGDRSLKLTRQEREYAMVFLPGDLKNLEMKFLVPLEDHKCRFDCRNEDSFSCARRVKEEENGADVLVLNLANPVNPGGGVRRGATAQEEDLCRKSSLLLSLESEYAEKYYRYNRSLRRKDKRPEQTLMGSDAAIITPQVEIVKDENGKLLEDSVIVSVLSCAAPMVRFGLEGMTQQEYEEMMYNRILNILVVSAYLGYQNLVLGAFGCGAFYNDSRLVSDLFKKAFDELELNGYGTDQLFSRVDFAVLGKGESIKNYNEFYRNFHKR